MSEKPTGPDRLSVGTDAVFERRPDLYVVHRGPTRSAGAALAVIPEHARSTYTVYKGKVPAADRDKAGPVYSAGPGGPLAVPTGRVFVRLEEGVSPDTRRDEFSAAGFEIERTLPYAANAAWLRPLQGGVAQALTRLRDLQKTQDVVHVEPQLLMERAPK